MRYALIFVLGLLAACGAEAPPSHDRAEPGLTLSGEARIGVRTEL